MFLDKFTEKIKSYNLYSITFSREVLSFMGRGKIWQSRTGIRFACSVHKTTDTLSEYVILTAFVR